MLNKEKIKMNFKISAPGILEMFIFSCFRFANWREELSPDNQFRVTCGALAIVVTFILYYACLFYYTAKSQNGYKTKESLYITFYALIGFLSFFFSYFLKPY